ncbi:MAG: flagellar basal body P-ring protein FlgI [Planctomycetota bacterium]
MNTMSEKSVLVAAALLMLYSAGGCAERQTSRGDALNLATADLGPTIGSLATVVGPEPIVVEGYGLVGGLKGTGSAECPPAIRTYLAREILRQLPTRGALDVEKFINSPDTAVVHVEGVIPQVSSKNEYFDVKVTALPSTQTTSLEGGGLFPTELKLPGNFGVQTRILADAEGPFFIDKISDTRADTRTGYILAGGKVLDEHKIIVRLDQRDFRLTNTVRNLINGRFGDTTARAVQPARIEVLVPAQYRQRRQRFIAMVKAMFLTQEAGTTAERITMLVRRLAGSEHKYDSEVALEAIGNQSVGGLRTLLDSPDEPVRLSAARCMLNLGSDAGLAILRQIAMDEGSPHRLEALESVGAGARRNDAAALARRLLQDGDFRIRLAAYEHLRRLDDVTITQEFIGRNFYLERITRTDHKAIFVSRSGQPCIVLFGVPIYCRDNIFVQSPEGDITVNASTGQDYVTLLRKHPKRPGVVAQARSSFKLDDVIKALCEEPPKEGDSGGGLGVSYADVVVLLKQMFDKGAVDAEFRAGPPPKIDLNIKK